ncbi:hypothetical protein VNO80_21208 [Phaseolus coccineus]|uniref:Uncharacterized protein n=1 Tax=Phaseolus coccineus TaxID=3886 RepID=A0AAN9QQP8_PHACN
MAMATLLHITGGTELTRTFTTPVKQQYWRKEEHWLKEEKADGRLKEEKADGRDLNRWRKDLMGNTLFRITWWQSALRYNFDHIIPYSKVEKAFCIIVESCKQKQIG